MDRTDRHRDLRQHLTKKIYVLDLPTQRISSIPGDSPRGNPENRSLIGLTLDPQYPASDSLQHTAMEVISAN